MFKWIALCLSLLSPTLALSQVVSVEFKEKGLFFSDAPTLNFLWPSKQAKATLVFIPGGEGKAGITPERVNLGGFYGTTLRPLSDEKRTHGAFNVVVFESPTPLPVGTEFPVSRQGQEHLKRIESVVRFFKDKYSLPVWIMGHSNGAVSITEFYKMLQKNQQQDLIAGAIYSSARHGAEFNDKTQLPILFLAHEQDKCPKSTPARGLAVFQQQQKTNLSKTAFVFIKGGEIQTQNGCHSGFHMFYGAGAEAYSAIDEFVFGPRN